MFYSWGKVLGIFYLNMREEVINVSVHQYINSVKFMFILNLNTLELDLLKNLVSSSKGNIFFFKLELPVMVQDKQWRRKIC